MTNNDCQRISFKNTDLASRAAGAECRETVLQLLQSGVRIEFDLKNVLSISESFADELFGVLASELGIETLKKRIRIEEAKPEVLDSIVLAISYRLGKSEIAAA